jgi:replicative DNA helicase
MTLRIEETILSNLLYNDDFCKKVLPYLKPEYFTARPERLVLETMTDFFSKYSKAASHEILRIEVSNRKDLTEREYKEVEEYIDNLEVSEVDSKWLTDQTESFCKAKAILNAIQDSIIIIDGKDKNRKPDAIPSLLQQALAVSFEQNIGHDYFADAESRYDFYHSPQAGVKFDIDLLNKITGGIGLRNKTLTCVAAGTGAGKSLFMVHCAAAALLQGKNVLYITMEMSDNRIGERCDANLFNTPINQLKDLDRESYKARIGKVAAKSKGGQLVIKEFPTSSAHAGHFRAVLEDLRIKRGFKPDLVVIDYLNICASQRFKAGVNVNSYTLVKAIAEEIRALAVEYDVPILTGTQVNRGGINNSDLEMTDTSESMGLVHALDLYLALIRTDELDERNQLMIKQLKNRYGDPSYYKRFIVGIDRPRMKLFNVEDSEQNLSDSGTKDDDGPAFDKTRSGRAMTAERNPIPYVKPYKSKASAADDPGYMDFDFGDD